MDRYTCIAVDDEPLALKQMTGYIGQVPGLHLTGTCRNGIDALCRIQENPVDLLFLDIQMEDITGLQLLGTLRIMPVVILTTAYDQYALKGYDFDVCDYLLKPISFERFLKGCNKAFALMAGRKSRQAGPSILPENKIDPQGQCIFVKCDYRICRVCVDEILFIEGCRDYLKIHTHNHTYLTLMNFRKIGEMLPEGKFARVHKSFLVPVNRIDTIGRHSIRIAGKEIPLGEFYKMDFFRALEKNGITGAGL